MEAALRVKDEEGLVAPERRGSERSELARRCDWHGQEIGGARGDTQVLTRGPDEGNPTPMRQGHWSGIPGRSGTREGEADPQGGVRKKP